VRHTVARWLDVLADAEVLGPLLNERVLVAVSTCSQYLTTMEPTFAAFLEPGFEPPGKGAGAAFFPFGAYIPVLPSVPVAVIERRGLRAISSNECPSSSLKRLQHAFLHTEAQAIINIRTRLELRVSKWTLHCESHQLRRRLVGRMELRTVRRARRWF
jgi:hypothetical protein